MRGVLEDITQGRGQPGDIELLEEMAEGVKTGSLCGLGQTAPNPVLTTIRYFREEYEAHIYEQRCPAGTCKDFVSYFISPDLCVGCLLCLKNCSSKAITGALKQVHIIDQDLCTRCDVCYQVCPSKIDAVRRYSPQTSLPLPEATVA